MFKKIESLQLKEANDALVAAIRTAHAALGWNSTKALLWLVTPPAHGIHVLVPDGPVYVSPRPDECAFRFRIDVTIDTGRITGWSGKDSLCLTRDYFEAVSCDGHKVLGRIRSDGSVEIDWIRRPPQQEGPNV